MTWRPKRRIDSAGPSSASGGMMALTREPSSRRASTIGCASSMRRPTCETIFSMMCSRCALSLNRTGVSAQLAAALDVDLVVAVDQDVGDGGLLEQRFQRAQPKHFVEHFFDDPVLLGGGHRHALVFEQPLHHAADLGAHALLRNRADRSRFSTPISFRWISLLISIVRSAGRLSGGGAVDWAGSGLAAGVLTACAGCPPGALRSGSAPFGGSFNGSLPGSGGRPASLIELPYLSPIHSSGLNPKRTFPPSTSSGRLIRFGCSAINRRASSREGAFSFMFRSRYSSFLAFRNGK